MDEHRKNYIRPPSAGYKKNLGPPFSHFFKWKTHAQIFALSGAAKRLHDSGTIVYNLGSNISQAIGKEFESIGSDRCRLFSMGDFATGLRAAIPYLANSICAGMYLFRHMFSDQLCRISSEENKILLILFVINFPNDNLTAVRDYDFILRNM